MELFDIKGSSSDCRFDIIAAAESWNSRIRMIELY